MAKDMEALCFVEVVSQDMVGVVVDVSVEWEHFAPSPNLLHARDEASDRRQCSETCGHAIRYAFGPALAGAGELLRVPLPSQERQSSRWSQSNTGRPRGLEL